MGSDGGGAGAHELTQPLLGAADHGGAPHDDERRLAAAADGEPAQRQAAGTCSINGGVANFVVTAVGAGLLALSRAWATVGVALALALFAAATAATVFCCGAIVRAAAAHAAALGAPPPSYSELVAAEFGAAGRAVLQASVLAHLLGVMVIYLIIIPDVLVGSPPDYAGVLPEALGRRDGPWFLHRETVAGAVLFFLIGPMLAPRSLAGVARFSRAGVYMVLFLACSIASLAGLALATGRAARDASLAPPPAAVASPAAAARASASFWGVTCLAYTIHFNLLPIQRSLADDSPAAMLAVVRRGVGACAAVYAAVGTAGYLLFGGATRGDVLANLNIRAVAALVGDAPARVLVPLVGLAFTGALAVNFVLKAWAAREVLAEVVLARPVAALRPRAFYGLAAAPALAAYAASAAVRDVYVVVALVGGTASVVFSFALPAALVLKRSGDARERAAAAAVAALGAAVAVASVYDQVAPQPGGGPQL